MKSAEGTAAAKRRAGESAADLVTDGDVVGLGTGSTAAHAVRALGRRVDAGLDVRGVPTSHGTRALAREVGLPLTGLDEALPDLAIDGADQVAGDGAALVKGGGAAHAREKVIDAAADRFVVVVDPTKLSTGRCRSRSGPTRSRRSSAGSARRAASRASGPPSARTAPS
jgi:ribose 5-phosphate isomerase A